MSTPRRRLRPRVGPLDFPIPAAHFRCRARRRVRRQASMLDGVQIVVEDLVKRFTLPTGSFVALDRVSFEVREGEFFCIVGPSGCGKTTILRILAGLETRTDGDVAIHYHLNGRPRSAMVFQEQSVFPWMTVEANIAFGLRSQPMPAAT